MAPADQPAELIARASIPYSAACSCSQTIAARASSRASVIAGASWVGSRHTPPTEAQPCSLEKISGRVR